MEGVDYSDGEREGPLRMWRLNSSDPNVTRRTQMWNFLSRNCWRRLGINRTQVRFSSDEYSNVVARSRIERAGRLNSGTGIDLLGILSCSVEPSPCCFIESML